MHETRRTGSRWLAVVLVGLTAGPALALEGDRLSDLDPYAAPEVRHELIRTPTAGDAVGERAEAPLQLAPTRRSAAPSCPPGSTVHVQAGESIQAAVNDASPGDRLMVAPGVYNESVLIETACLTLKGGWNPYAASWAVMDGTGAGSWAFRVRADDVTIQGFEMHGYTGPPGWGIGVVSWQDEADRGTVKSNWIHDTQGSAVDLGTGPDGVYTAGWTIKANRIGTTSGFPGISLQRMSDNTVKDNDVTGSRGGIFLRRNAGTSVRDNRVSDTATFGILLNGASGNEVKDNEVVGSGLRNFLLIWGSNDNVVKGNLFVASGREGIYMFLGPSFRNLILDNVVLDSGGDGVSLTSNTMTASDNVFRDNQVSGSASGCDLYWDGGGSGNCWQNNLGSECPDPLPACD